MKKRKKQPSPAKPAVQTTAPREAAPGQVTPAPEIGALLPEPPEPRAEKRNIPVSLLVTLFVLIYWGDLYVMDHGADITGQAGAFPNVVYDPFTSYADLTRANPVSPEQEEHNKGLQIFKFICVQCHQPNGLGVPGQYPPLAGSDWVQHEDPGRIIRIVLNGLSGPLEVKGQSFNNTMPPWKTTLSDEQIAHVLTFIRREWGNNAPRVTPEEVADVRAQVKSRDTPFTPGELETLPGKKS